MFITIASIVSAIVAFWVAYQLIFGIAIFVLFLFWLLRLIVRNLTPPPGPEVVGELLTDEFKAAAKGKLAPDMWTDGRRIFFEVGDRSYSVAPDLASARLRKNELLAQL